MAYSLSRFAHEAEKSANLRRPEREETHKQKAIG
jgi:hypothetical protein